MKAHNRLIFDTPAQFTCFRTMAYWLSRPRTHYKYQFTLFLLPNKISLKGLPFGNYEFTQKPSHTFFWDGMTKSQITQHRIDVRIYNIKYG